LLTHGCRRFTKFLKLRKSLFPYLFVVRIFLLIRFMKKNLLSLLLITFSFNVSNGQVLKYKAIQDENLVYVLNNMTKMTEYEFKSGDVDLFINVFNVSDPSGSAGFSESEEITNSIYIAVSEDGEAPEQHLFRLSSVYDPKFIKWTKTPTGAILTIDYGTSNKRQRSTIKVTLSQLLIRSSKI